MSFKINEEFKKKFTERKERQELQKRESLITFLAT